MAKNNNTSLVLAPGEIAPTELDALLSDGFAESKIIKVGAKEGQVPAYVGKLVGPGRPIELKDDKTGEISEVPTWAFKPVTGKDGTVRENVTHVMMAPHSLNQELGRIFDTAQREGKKALVGVVYNGQLETRRGFRVNDYRIVEKYLD